MRATIKRYIADFLVWWAFRLDPQRFMIDKNPTDKFNFTQTPYVREIVDCLKNDKGKPPVYVTVMKGSSVGATNIGISDSYLSPLYGLPENRPLYKDSGLWQLRSDDDKEVILQQSVNETDLGFLQRCKDYNTAEIRKLLSTDEKSFNKDFSSDFD